MNKLLTIQEYVTIAEKLVNKFGSKWMLSQDYLDVIISKLISSDMKYDKNLPASIESYRFGAFKYAIQVIYKMRKDKGKVCSIDNKNRLDQYIQIVDKSQKQPIEIILDEENVELNKKDICEMLDNEELTNKEKIYLSLIYKENWTQKQVAEHYKITRHAVSYIKQRGLLKIRRLYNAE